MNYVPKMQTTGHGWWFIGTVITALMLGPVCLLVILGWILSSRSTTKHNRMVEQTRHEQLLKAMSQRG